MVSSYRLLELNYIEWNTVSQMKQNFIIFNQTEIIPLALQKHYFLGDSKVIVAFFLLVFFLLLLLQWLIFINCGYWYTFMLHTTQIKNN